MRRILVLCLALLAAPVSAGLIIESTDALELITSTAAAIDYNCSWSDSTSTAFTPGKSAGATSSATTTTIVASPAGGTQRNVMQCTFRNAGATTNVLTVQRDVSAANRTIVSVTLAGGEALYLSQEGEWGVLNSSGIPRSAAAPDGGGVTGRTFAFQKTATAPDAAGYWYNYSKDAGQPGASVPGAPGVNGWTTDCSVANNAAEPAGAAQVGAHVLPDPTTGNLYLTSVSLNGATTDAIQLIDVLWYNTGLTVTTTTAQSFTQPTLPARDQNGSSNGEDVQLALLTTTANTNAGAIPGTTATYTDSEGNAGNTATFFALAGWQAPATPVIGTWMPFAMAAGDHGVRTVASVTLQTSYAGGALSAVLYRPLVTIGTTVANVPTTVSFPAPGIRIYTNSCIMAIAVGTATANTLAGSYTIVER